MSRRVLEVVAAALEVAPGTIDESTSNENLAAWDSLRQMQLVFALEETFGVTFDDDEIPRLTGVGQVLALLRAKGATLD